MATTSARRWRWGSLALALLCAAIAVGLFLYLPAQLNTAHVTVQPTPGSSMLPPTATRAP